MRKAVEASQPERVAFELRFGQSKPIYNAVMTLRNTPALYDKLSPEQKRIVDINVKDFKTSGVGLDPVKRKEYNAIVDELAKLSTNFTNNVQDATAVSKAQQRRWLPCRLPRNSTLGIRGCQQQLGPSCRALQHHHVLHTCSMPLTELTASSAAPPMLCLCWCGLAWSPAC